MAIKKIPSIDEINSKPKAAIIYVQLVVIFALAAFSVKQDLRHEREKEKIQSKLDKYRDDISVERLKRIDTYEKMIFYKEQVLATDSVLKQQTENNVNKILK